MTKCRLKLRLEPTKVLWNWWSGHAASGALPRRSQLDPVAFRTILPKIWLANWSDEDGDFVYRLSGEELNAVYGQSLRGKRLGEIVLPDLRDFVRSLWVRVLEGPGILHVYGRIYKDPVSVRMGERLILPLADAAGEPAFILGMIAFRADNAAPLTDLDPAQLSFSNRILRLYPVEELVLERIEC